MNPKTKIFCIIILSALFLFFTVSYILFFNNQENTIRGIISPVEMILDNGKFSLKDIDSFDIYYSDKNKKIAKELNITEDEAFILGNLGKYWAKNILQERKIRIYDNDIFYHRFRYGKKLENSSFGLKNGAPTNKKAFERLLKTVRQSKYVLLDLDTDISYPVSKENAEKLKNFVVVKKRHTRNLLPKKPSNQIINTTFSSVYKSNNFKIVVSDLTTKLLPDRNCSSDICREILSDINQAQKTIDIAIYGYTRTPQIENALKNAVARGVKLRLVYDLDSKGHNIYPETGLILKLAPDNTNDKNSNESNKTMHNKFYIIDNQKVITGSANLSHTDMSGYNSNSIIVINSPKVAEFYTDEFNQMYSGKFHNDKKSTQNKISDNITVFFSPQDKAITNGILPIIKQAKKYIYIPTFVITEKRITAELINAQKRGVEVRIIADALNAATKHSKHKELRNAGILVKAENYAGKMHSKSMIIDDEYLIIGSMNFSNSGENHNDENMIILHDKGAAEFYKKFFIYQWGRIPDKWLKYTPRAEGVDSIGSCSDGLDNNYDGKTDKEDDACKKY